MKTKISEEYMPDESIEEDFDKLEELASEELEDMVE